MVIIILYSLLKKLRLINKQKKPEPKKWLQLKSWPDRQERWPNKQEKN
jgi:hypothetical protein